MQTLLDPKIQAAVVAIAARQYPDAANIEAPLLVALPAGIHPYNRAGGYFDHEANAVVAYQALGRSILREGVESDHFESFAMHELAHWYQYRVLGYRGGASSVNTHRTPSWKEACFIASRNLWPELGMERWQFEPLKSARVGAKVTKIQREGALTDVELHHWPDSLADRIAAKKK